MKIQRIALIGGSGFVGRHLVGHLRNRGYECRVITRHAHRHYDLRPAAEVVEANPFDHTQLTAALHGCDAAILGQADAMNAENEHLGLPLIELGVGITYAADAPTYLYDQFRKVTVSPAIARARELSSCDATLRESCTLPGRRGLCVATPVQGQQGEAGDVAPPVRYNVNGIELDAPAFSQLHVEISLHRLKVRDKQGTSPAVLFAGTCADVNGDSHWLLVREHAVKLWMGRQLLDRDDDGHRYYEVVSDPRLVRRVGERLAEVEPGRHETAPGVRQLR